MNEERSKREHLHSGNESKVFYRKKQHNLDEKAQSILEINVKRLNSKEQKAIVSNKSNEVGLSVTKLQKDVDFYRGII